MRTITFLGVLFMVARAGANGLPTDAEILRVRCGSTCEQSSPQTLEAGIREKKLGVTVEAWAFMYDETTETYPHLKSGAIWIIGTTADGQKFWDDPLDHHLTTLDQVRKFARQRGYIKVEVGRNRRHGAKLVLPSQIPVCQQGPAVCEQEMSRLTKELEQVRAERDQAWAVARTTVVVSAPTTTSALSTAPAVPASVVVVKGKGKIVWFWLAIIVLIVVVVIQQWIIRDRVATLKSEREQAERDVKAERAVREADRQAVFHWGMRLCDVAERIGLPTTNGYENRLVEALARRLNDHTDPPNPISSA